MVRQHPVISADSHVVEPADIFVERVDEEYRDRAPRVVANESNILQWVLDDFAIPVGNFGASGKLGQDLDEETRQGYEGMQPGGWDPEARLKDQDVDGVCAEIIYPSIGRYLYRLKDARLVDACVQAYNRWLAEYCAVHPERLVGIGLINLDDVSVGVAELERCAKLGLRGAAIWETPPDDKPYTSPEYEAFWSAAAELGLPLSMHANTRRASSWPLATGWLADPPGPETELCASRPTRHHGITHTLVQFIVGGILDRHPDLRIVSVELDVGWFPYFVQMLDHGYKITSTERDWLRTRPSETIRNQVFATFEEDRVGVASWELFGEDNYMWASDYPHPAGTWPNSQRVIEDMFIGVPENVAAKILRDNVAKLYKLESSVLSPA